VERAKTFVGTPQYMSPELLESSETSKRYDRTFEGLIAQLTISTVQTYGRSGVFSTR